MRNAKRSTLPCPAPYTAPRSRALDLTRDEFAALFGPNGAFAAFFAKHLEGRVDTTLSPWRWKRDADPRRDPTLADASGGSAAAAGAARGEEPSDGLAQFERAAAIRAAFFGGLDPDALAVAFTVTPQSLEGDAIGVTFSSDGQQATLSRGVRGGQPVALAWPGRLGSIGAGVDFQPAGAGTLARRGLWALFHLVDAAASQEVDGDGVHLAYAASRRSANFLLHVDTAFNPFDLKALRAFHCPKAL